MPSVNKVKILADVNSKADQYANILAYFENNQIHILDVEILCNQRLNFFKVLINAFESADAENINISLTDYVKIYG